MKSSAMLKLELIYQVEKVDIWKALIHYDLVVIWYYTTAKFRRVQQLAAEEEQREIVFDRNHATDSNNNYRQ